MIRDTYRQGRVSKLWTILLIVVVFFFVISFSIALPIWFRPFYYWQIKSLDIPASSGFSAEVIREAFDELMDYLNFNKPFGTGQLKYSEEGKSHFEDCKALFDLDTYVCLGTGGFLLLAALLDKRKKLSPYRFGGFRTVFFSGILVIVVVATLFWLFSRDYDAAFETFHKIFFPGKDNWLFSPLRDEIIKVLTDDFFKNCAILIGSSMACLSVGAIVWGAVTRKRAGI